MLLSFDHFWPFMTHFIDVHSKLSIIIGPLQNVCAINGPHSFERICSGNSQKSLHNSRFANFFYYNDSPI